MNKAINARQNRWAQLLHWLGWPNDSLLDRRGEKAGSSLRAAGGNGELSRYDQYHLTRREFRIAACAGYLFVFVASYLFYRSLVLAAILAVAGIAAPRYHRRSLLERRRLRLSLQFKEALYSIASSLAAGRSVENAFVTALTDLRLLYPNPETDILVEFEIMEARMAYGESLEQALLDFSRRARIDDIAEFADVFTTCKRSGGDLVEVIRRTSQTIGEKLDVQQEIVVMIAQKRLEARIMMAVPFVFLAFMSFAAPDYMAPLYGGIGYVMLTVSLLLLGLCYAMMIKIMDIRM